MNKLFAVFLFACACVLPVATRAKTMTVEADVTTVMSPDVEVVTGAAPPAVSVSSTGRDGELRLSLSVDGNPSYTRYAVKETSSGKYVDPVFGALRDEPAWGLYEDWGSEQGVVVMVGSLSSPAFIGISKNSIDEVSPAPETASLYGNYRASRQPAEVITEAVMYAIGILVFAGIAIHQFLRLRGRKSGKGKK